MLNPAGPGNAPEARESLLQIAGRRTLPIPSELVVEHVIGLPGPWDWPVRRAGLEAILRRLASGAVTVNRRNDGGVVIEAPPEAARALVSLFEGMSRLMAAAAAPGS